MLHWGAASRTALAVAFVQKELESPAEPLVPAGQGSCAGLRAAGAGTPAGWTRNTQVLWWFRRPLQPKPAGVVVPNTAPRVKLPSLHTTVFSFSLLLSHSPFLYNFQSGM